MSTSDDYEMRKLEQRTPRSKAIFEQARVDVPFGVHSTYRYSEPYPFYFSRAKGYRDIIVDEHLTAQMSQAGLSGAVAFSTTPVTDWRSFQPCDTGKWFAYCFAMMNRGIIPAGPSPDEQWTISVVHTKDEIQEHLEAFKEIANYVKRFDKPAEIVEAI